MNIFRKLGCLEFVVLLAAFACAGSRASGQVRSVRDSAEAANMTETMKTVCVGRHLVDVPAQAVVSMSDARIDGFAIQTTEESEAAFQKRLAGREAEIGTARIGVDGRGPGGMIESHDLRIPGMVGRTFVFGHTRSHGFERGQRVDGEWMSAESHAHIGNPSFSLSAKYVQESDARVAEALLAQLRLRTENEIPATPGFCIWRAVFAEPLPVRKAEHSVMHLGLPGHPDLELTLVSLPGGGSEPDLLARSAQTEASMGADLLLRMTKLRAGRLSINGIDGEELVVRAREFNLTTTYGLNWESRGAADNSLQPYLLLELQTGLNDRPGGEPVDTSLHEDALLSLWDSIASGIRLRPAAPRQPARPSPPPPG